jgi:hypothetical protein
MGVAERVRRDGGGELGQYLIGGHPGGGPALGRPRVQQLPRRPLGHRAVLVWHQQHCHQLSGIAGQAAKLRGRP